MIGDTEDTRSFGWALPASVVAHAAVAVLLIVGLPVSLPEPQPEDVVDVTLVDPPKPPEPTPPQETAAQPPAAAAQAPEPAASEDSAAAQPMRTLNSVVKFGETDAGPREDLTGSSAEDDTDEPKPATLADAKQQPAETKREEVENERAHANPTELTTEAADTAETSAAADDAREVAPAVEQTHADDVAQADGNESEGIGTAPDQLTARAEAPEKTAEPAPTTKTSLNQTSAANPASGPKLDEARTLFSRSPNRGSTASTAMANIPRGLRGGQLCATELRLQLQNGATSYAPRALPSYDMKDSNVLKVQHGVFLTSDGWYSLAFECQVDAEATEVKSFALHVGEPLSAEETSRRGLPTR